VPVEYEGTLKPQSWAAGAPLLVLRTLLGLDVANGRLRRHPDVPAELGRLRLDGIVTSRRSATRRPAARRAARGGGATAGRDSGGGRAGG
jgi:hypothetical protein